MNEVFNLETPPPTEGTILVDEEHNQYMETSLDNIYNISVINGLMIALLCGIVIGKGIIERLWK